MNSTTLWRVSVAATQRDGSIKGRVVNVHGPKQPKIRMAVALTHYDPDVEVDESDIEFRSVRINRIGVRELIYAIIASNITGFLIGAFFR